MQHQVEVNAGPSEAKSLASGSTYCIENTQLAPSENRSQKSADGRVATEAAWRNGKDKSVIHS